MTIDIPDYSPEAYLSYDVLYNEESLMIFIEDTNGVDFYESIFRRLFINQSLQATVKSLAGKKKLNEVFNHYITSGKSGTTAIFIGKSVV